MEASRRARMAVRTGRRSRLFPRLHFFFFNDTAPTEIYTLPLPAALPIFVRGERREEERQVTVPLPAPSGRRGAGRPAAGADRKSTRLNSSHSQISYAVFCLKQNTT